MRPTKKLDKKIEKWIANNGACNINVKEEEILLYNCGLFQDCNNSYAKLWIGELDDTIRYLRRLKSFLNKNGFNTRRSAQDYFSAAQTDKGKNKKQTSFVKSTAQTGGKR